MLYQETFQSGEDPNHQDICIVRYFNPYPCKQKSFFPPHSHVFYEIDYTFDGTAIFELDNHSVTVQAGSFLFFAPFCVHSITHDTRYSHITIQFSSHLLQKNLPGFTENNILTADRDLLQHGTLNLCEFPDNTLYNIMKHLITLYQPFYLSGSQADNNKESSNELTFTAKIQQQALLLLLIAELLNQGYLRISNTGLHTAEISQMHHLIGKLIEHPEEKLTMEDAAAMVHMGYSNFCRTFKTTIGYSYVDFCNMQRVSRAKELLKYTDLSVTEISIQLNFGSISYFNRIFKKFTGTPLAYRLHSRSS